jgi:hypothetical protein
MNGWMSWVRATLKMKLLTLESFESQYRYYSSYPLCFLNTPAWPVNGSSGNLRGSGD